MALGAARRSPAGAPGPAGEPDRRVEAVTAVDPADLAAVAAQLGREPRAIHEIGHRCPCGNPDVVTTLPRLPNGTPFPTTYYLTCPRAASRVGTLEDVENLPRRRSHRPAGHRLDQHRVGARLVFRQRRLEAGRHRPARLVGDQGHALASLDAQTGADGIARAAQAVASRELEPSSLYTHRFGLEHLGAALDATRDRPDGFLKALIEF